MGHCKTIFKEGKCASCYANIVEKRITRFFRSKLSPADTALLIVNDGSAAGVVLEFIVRKILSHSSRKIEVKDILNGAEGYDKIFLPISLEDGIIAKLAQIFDTGELKDSPKLINLLEQTPEEDLAVLAQQRRLNFKQSKKSSNIFDDIEQKSPGTKKNLAKSLRII